MNARSMAPWIVATLIVAGAAHLASVWYLPHAIMHIAMNRMGEANAMHHGKRVDASSRGVVRPSPDLLYSTCPFDLSHGPLRVRAPIPKNTYWSVSLFDMDTNNFYVLNDRQIPSSVADFLVVQKGTHPYTEDFPVVIAPQARGLLLIRVLIDDEKHFALIDALRRQATCEPWQASPADVSSKGR